jgi:hypothetical protein
MRIVKKILLALVVVFIIIQFIQPAQNKSEQVLPTDLTKTFHVPENVHAMLLSACYDCHSNNTNYPWYSKIQPFGWMLANHISKGKAEVNFSDFGIYSKRRQVSKMNGIANSVKEGSMPLSSYTMMHKEARLSQDEKALLIDWAIKTKDSLRSNN